MAEATIDKDCDVIDETTPAAGYASGEVIQMPDGRAAFVAGLCARTSGDVAGLKTSGQVTLAKTAAVVVLKGAPLYWDRSLNSCTPLKAVAGADFFIGTAVDDAIAAATTVVVNLNVRPNYTIDLLRDPSDTVLVGSAVLTQFPGYAKFVIESTSEAQKVDALSQHSIPVSKTAPAVPVPFIVEGRMAIYVVGSDATVDMNVGIANETHADDADAIAESVFLHFDNALTILAESDDGTTEVEAVTTTIDSVDDTYFDFAIDARDLADIQIYINGVNVLPASVFNVELATGPLKLLVHLEKTTGTATGELRISKLALRARAVAAGA